MMMPVAYLSVTQLIDHMLSRITIVLSAGFLVPASMHLSRSSMALFTKKQSDVIGR